MVLCQHFQFLKCLFFVTGKMAVPPAYADLGKSAKDIFNKGYGNWKQDKRQFFKCVFFALQRIGWLFETRYPT